MHNTVLVGAGRVGQSLARAFQQQGLLGELAIINQHYDSAVAACDFIGHGKPYATIAALPQAELILLTVPDDDILPSARSLLENNKITEQAIILHFSGALSSTILRDAALPGGRVASFHPIFSFAEPMVDLPAFYCGYEGDERACQVGCELLASIGAKLLAINTENKLSYHIASVMLSNHLIALTQVAKTLFNDAGLSHEHAKAISLNLMTSTLNNIENQPTLLKALTGPLKRGDVKTIKQHQLQLRENNEYALLYQQLAKQLLTLVEHDESKHHELLQALDI